MALRARIPGARARWLKTLLPMERALVRLISGIDETERRRAG